MTHIAQTLRINTLLVMSLLVHAVQAQQQFYLRPQGFIGSPEGLHLGLEVGNSQVAAGLDMGTLLGPRTYSGFFKAYFGDPCPKTAPFRNWYLKGSCTLYDEKGDDVDGKLWIGALRVGRDMYATSKHSGISIELGFYNMLSKIQKPYAYTEGFQAKKIGLSFSLLFWVQASK